MKLFIILILTLLTSQVYSSISNCYSPATRNSEYCKLLISKGYFDLSAFIKADFERGGPRKNKEGKFILTLPKLQPSTLQSIYPIIVTEYLKYGIEIKHGAVLDQPTNTLILCIDTPCPQNKEQRVPRPAPVEAATEEEEEEEETEEEENGEEGEIKEKEKKEDI